MGLAIYQVDAFTDEPFRGNPAGVCLLPKEQTNWWMQKVAAEMNLSETAFLVPQADGYGLRWFTPTTEVELCGHATLASAHVLFTTGLLAKEQEARFHTRSGLLTARTGENGWLEMNFPAVPAREVEPLVELEKALWVIPVYIGHNGADYLVEVEREDVLRKMEPDLAALARLKARGVIVTCRGSGKYDFVSRFFAPAVGVPEDPVTGSAHCALGPYWQAKLGKDELFAYQASARGGSLRVKVAGDRVQLAGQAVTVLKCELQV